MARFAKLINNVIDVISFDPDRDSSGNVTSDWIEVPDDVFAGFVRQDATWAPPPEPEPDPDPEVESPPEGEE